MRKKTAIVLELLIVMLIVLLSKTIFFGIMYKKITSMVLVFLCISIPFIWRKHVSKKILLTLTLFISLILMGLLVHFSDINREYFFTEMAFIFLLFEMSIIVNYIDKQIFIKNYINVMVIISGVSLLYYYISLNHPSLISKLSTKVMVGTKKIIVSPFYTWGFDSFIYPRNAGPFWEPGAFQGFVLIAIIMLLFYKDNMQRVKPKIIILSATLITTQSTAGYILLGLIYLAFGTDIIKIFSNKNTGKRSLHSILIVPIVAISLLYLAFYIFDSEIISNKFADDNISFIARSEDVYNSMRMISEKPFFGYGSGIEKSARELSLGIVDNSVGMLSLFYTYGSIFFVVYIYKFKNGIDSLFPYNNIIKRLAVYIVFIVLYMTQGLYYLPFFSIFLFEWPESTEI